jgi:outer membrane protein OmpA-like peptidoglycan-associated protein
MNLKMILGVGALCALCACASAQKEDTETPRPVKQDPAIEEQAKENARLYSQTPAQMYKSHKLPSITYDFDSIRPPEYAYEFLDKVAKVMKEHESLHLIVQGHADIVGSDEYNYWISGARAAAMKSYLVSRGVNAERIRIHAYGKERPITLDNSSAGRRANRRVEFQFTTREWNSIY